MTTNFRIKTKVNKYNVELFIIQVKYKYIPFWINIETCLNEIKARSSLKTYLFIQDQITLAKRYKSRII